MTTHKHIHIHKNKTSKKKQLYGHNIDTNKNGWKAISIYGDAFDRGFAHGTLLYKELSTIKKAFPIFVKEYCDMSLEEYMKVSLHTIKPIIKEHFHEFYQELQGISQGARRAGAKTITLDFLIAWNSYLSLYNYQNTKWSGRCSAFIATGNATRNGDIIMAHNTHCSFFESQFFNIILYVYPTTGHSFVMQTAAGYIASGVDWFITSSGIMGCETTISNVNYNSEFGFPYFCRIRQAMQYGDTFDDYCSIMDYKNAGDYASSWLFGNIHTNEIMLYEQGYKYKSIQRTKNGVYYGFNSAMNNTLRKKETDDIDHTNITTSSGCRHQRFEELLNKRYRGVIDTNNAKKIIADHYDCYLEKNRMGTRGICKHNEVSEEHNETDYPYSMFGTVDAKTVNSEMAKKMEFLAIYGSACGRRFSIKKHIENYPYYKKSGKFVKDFIGYDWVLIEK